MLTMIASARNGERTTSITADVKFLVVIVFIGFCLLDPVMRGGALRDEHEVYNRCASGPTAVFWGFWSNLSPAVDKDAWARRVVGP